MKIFRTLIVATILLLAACGGSPATPEAKTPPGAPAATTASAANSGDVGVKSITLKKDDGGKPGKETTSFTVADRVWHVEVALDKFATNAKFKLTLIEVRSSRNKNRDLGSLDGSALVANNLTFKIPIDGAMAIGQYRGDLYLSDKKIKEIDFVVEPTKGNGDISVKAWRIYNDDGKGAPGTEVKAFATADRAHHFEVDTEGANIKPIVVKWLFTALDGGKITPIAEFESENIIEDTILVSKLTFKNDIPSGQYYVELLLNGKSAGKFEYAVRK